MAIFIRASFQGVVSIGTLAYADRWLARWTIGRLQLLMV